MPLQSVPLFGLGSGTKSVNVSAQLRTNFYAEMAQDAEKGPLAFYPRQGLTQVPSAIWPTISASTFSGYFGKVITGPVRGSITAPLIVQPIGSYPREWLYLVSGNCIYGGIDLQIGPLGDGTLPLVSNKTMMLTSAGPVGIATNGFDILVVDGVAGYCTLTNATGGGRIASTNFPNGTTTACFLASRYFVPDPAAPGRFRWSALNDGTTWNALDFATAEFAPDPLVATFSARGELMLFGSQTIEFWTPTGDTSIVTRINGTTQQWGCLAAQSIKAVAGTVAFLGRAQGGDRQVVILNGYQPMPISTPDVDNDIANDPTPDAAVADVYTLNGHTFYVLNLTSKTWVYDLTTKNWSVWTTNGGRFAGQYAVQRFGDLMVCDYRDMRLYNFASTTYTDDGATLTRELVSRHVFNSGERFSCDEVVIDMETGVGNTSDPGLNPQAMLQVSKNGGHTWGNEMWQTIGAQGAYTNRVRWTRLGRGRDWMFKMRVTDPVKSVVAGAYARFS